MELYAVEGASKKSLHHAEADMQLFQTVVFMMLWVQMRRILDCIQLSLVMLDSLILIHSRFPRVRNINRA